MGRLANMLVYPTGEMALFALIGPYDHVIEGHDHVVEGRDYASTAQLPLSFLGIKTWARSQGGSI